MPQKLSTRLYHHILLLRINKVKPNVPEINLCYNGCSVEMGGHIDSWGWEGCCSNGSAGDEYAFICAQHSMAIELALAILFLPLACHVVCSAVHILEHSIYGETSTYHMEPGRPYLSAMSVALPVGEPIYNGTNVVRG